MTLLHNHVFTVLASNETTAAELQACVSASPLRCAASAPIHTCARSQLGGTDPSSYLGEMFYASPMEDVAGYGVPVLSLKYGEVELFTFAPASNKTSLTAVMDSGSSCFILPDTDVNGTFTESPYARWQRAAATVRVQHATLSKESPSCSQQKT